MENELKIRNARLKVENIRLKAGIIFLAIILGAITLGMIITSLIT